MFIFSYKNVTISCRGYISKTGLCWGRKSWFTNHNCKRSVLGVLSSECLLTPSKVFMIYDQRFGDQSVWSKIWLSCRMSRGKSLLILQSITESLLCIQHCPKHYDVQRDRRVKLPFLPSRNSSSTWERTKSWEFKMVSRKMPWEW